MATSSFETSSSAPPILLTIPSAIFNLASTNFIVFLGKNEFKWQFFKIGEQRLGQCGAKNVERFTILRVILAQGPC